MNNLKTPPSRPLTEFLYTKASRMLVPLSGTFELSPVCNFACRMCYVRKTAREVRESPRSILTLDDWRRIAREAREEGLLYLLLTGGEPLLWPDFWTLYDELIDMGFIISVNTNGSLIDEKAVAHFVRKPPQKLSITLYGANDETYRRLCGADGVFTKVDRAIRSLIGAGIMVKINCSLTPDNAADLDWLIDYARDVGANLAVTTYMFPPIRRDPGMVGVNERFNPEESARYTMRYLRRHRGEAQYHRFLEQVVSGYAEPPGLDEGCVDPIDGKIRCRAGKASFWITWDGWLTPCGMMPEPKVDLKTMDFAAAWQRLTEESAKVRLSGVCDQCPNRELCHPCAAMAYTETGSASGIPTYLCESTKHMRSIARATLDGENDS